MKTKLTTALVVALGTLALAANAQDNNPPNDGPPPAQHMGGAGPQRGFHLLPPPLVQQLKLTDDQKTQIAALEADTKAKLEKILTADQLAQLKNFRPPMRPGGPGGRGQGRHPGGDDNQPPSGPPPGDNDNNTPPSGPPPGEN